MKRGWIDSVILLLCCSLYFCNQLLIRAAKYVPVFFASYFSDLLAMPAILAYINLLLALFRRRRMRSLGKQLLLCAACSYVWEIAAVELKAGAVCDPYDVVCYFCGTVAYWAILKFVGGDDA